jgi:hypothetical protein
MPPQSNQGLAGRPDLADSGGLDAHHDSLAGAAAGAYKHLTIGPNATCRGWHADCYRFCDMPEGGTNLHSVPLGPREAAALPRRLWRPGRATSSEPCPPSGHPVAVVGRPEGCAGCEMEFCRANPVCDSDKGLQIRGLQENSKTGRAHKGVSLGLFRTRQGTGNGQPGTGPDRPVGWSVFPVPRSLFPVPTVGGWVCFAGAAARLSGYPHNCGRESMRSLTPASRRRP